MADETQFGPAETNGGNLPQVSVLAQYVTDLSFENPNAPGVYQKQAPPQVDVQFNIGTRVIGDDVHEVTLKIEVAARIEDQPAFQVELAYSGLFGLRNMPQDQVQPFLLAEAPRLLFPFARRLLADTVRDGNFAALMLEPIDFHSLYLRQQAQLAQGVTSGSIDIPGTIGQG